MKNDIPPLWNPGELLLTQRISLPKSQLLGEMGRQRFLFCATAPYSEYSFACVSDNPNFQGWMQCCIKAFHHFGKVPRVTTCGYVPKLNARKGRGGLRAGCSAHFLNAFSAHYGTVLFRSGKNIRETSLDYDEPLLRPLKSVFPQFVSKNLAKAPYISTLELDNLVAELVDTFNNNAGIQGISRKEDFETNEAPCMLTLPNTDYDMSIWCDRSVQSDYHFNYDSAFYSVPYQYMNSIVRVRVMGDRVEAYSGGELIATHSVRSGYGLKKVSTNPSHRPLSHRKIATRLQDYFKESARKVGPATASVMNELLAICEKEDGCYRRCKDLLNLRNTPSIISLEEACRIVLREGLAESVTSVAKTMNAEDR